MGSIPRAVCRSLGVKEGGVYGVGLGCAMPAMGSCGAGGAGVVAAAAIPPSPSPAGSQASSCRGQPSHGFPPHASPFAPQWRLCWISVRRAGFLLTASRHRRTLGEGLGGD